MTLILAVFVVFGFAATIGLMNMPHYARAAGQRSLDALATLRDATLDDRAKEESLQADARHLLWLLARLAGGTALAIAWPMAVVWVLEQAGIASFEGVLSILQRVDFFLATVVVGLVGYWIVRKLTCS